MAVDYRQYKTPYYEITIYSPDNKRSAKLPSHILRLVQSVEIQESFASDLNETGGNTFKISLIEGSREPASPNSSLGTQGLYKLKDDSGSVDMDISGSITNRTGSIVDLRFSGNSGITFITAQEKATNRVDGSVQDNVIGDKTTRTYKQDKKAPEYLFDYGNKVKITWGYLENWNLSKRTMIFKIYQVETIFADSGPNMVNISGGDQGIDTHKISPSGGGIPFGEVISTKNGFHINFNDLSTDAMLQQICKNAGWAHIISTNLASSTYDRNKQKIWISGQSFHEFLVKLAKLNNAYYQLTFDPQTGKTLLVFMKKQDFELKSPIKDPSLLIYKSPGSLIRTVTVNVDFSDRVRHEVGNTDSKGNVSANTTDVTESVMQFGETQVNSDPRKDPDINSLVVNNMGDNNITSKKEITPVENNGFQGDLVGTRLGDNTRILEITVDMIGYPKMMPGVITIGGLGVRYSGKYRVLSVEHIINDSGYETRFNGTTFTLPKGEGLQPPDAPIGQPDENVDQSQFALNTATSTPIDQLHSIYLRG